MLCAVMLCINVMHYAVNILKTWKDRIIIDIVSNSDD